MKRYLLASPVLFVLLSLSALADTVTILLFPNDGSGDNFGFVDQGKGFSITVGGGAPFFYLNAFPYAPGTLLGGGTDIFFGGGVAIFNGIEYDLTFAGTGFLSIPSFTLPASGNFSLDSEASFSVTAFLPDGQAIGIGASAPGVITFDYETFPGEPPFYVANPEIFTFTTVPEPETLGLLATGFVGIFTVARKRSRHWNIPSLAPFGAARHNCPRTGAPHKLAPFPRLDESFERNGDLSGNRAVVSG